MFVYFQADIKTYISPKSGKKREKFDAWKKSFSYGKKYDTKIDPFWDTSFDLHNEWKLGYCKNDHLINEPRYTRGKITDFNIWSRHLSDVEMARFTIAMKNVNTGNITIWWCAVCLDSSNKSWREKEGGLT